mmetsp:Transcript_2931/g.10923  ORF Transcript_2931/g.10923 Transcript_2931/m.10923 type:complete len:213 (+) Transcript_2931:1123-1761(+)
MPSSTSSLAPPRCASHTRVFNAALTASITTTASAAPSVPLTLFAIISDSVSTCEHRVRANGTGTHSARASSLSRHEPRGGLASRADPLRRSPMPPSGAAPPSDSLPYAESISPRVGEERASPSSSSSSSSLSSATRWSFRVDTTPTADDAASAHTSLFSPSMNQVMPAAPCSMADSSARCRRTKVRYFFINPATPPFGSAGDDAMAASAVRV